MTDFEAVLRERCTRLAKDDDPKVFGQNGLYGETIRVLLYAHKADKRAFVMEIRQQLGSLLPENYTDIAGEPDMAEGIRAIVARLDAMIEEESK